MTSSRRAAQAAFALAATVVLALPASAQRHPPRYAVAVDPRPATPSVPYSAYPGSSVTIDPRGRGGPNDGRHGPPSRQLAGPQVVYVPVVVDAYGYPAAQGPYAPQGAYYPQGTGVGVTDVNGRPLNVGFEAPPAAFGAPSYTPDLTGAPYVVGQDGVMIVALPSGERSIPACAAKPSTDPNGRPRTVFFQPTEYGLVLREGQSGRVQGPADPAPTACYGLDSFGRVTLR